MFLLTCCDAMWPILSSVSCRQLDFTDHALVTNSWMEVRETSDNTQHFLWEVLVLWDIIAFVFFEAHEIWMPLPSPAPYHTELLSLSISEDPEEKLIDCSRGSYEYQKTPSCRGLPVMYSRYLTTFGATTSWKNQLCELFQCHQY